MKSLKHIAIMLVALAAVSSCDYFMSFDLENQYREGIYIWSQKIGLNNEAQHGAVYYGKSKNGTVYVYTKNGWHAKPEVMPLSTLQEKIPNYGSIQGYRVGHSGYYNPHP